MAKNDEIIQYSEETQLLLLVYMISNSESFVRCRNIIKPNYWSHKYRPACKFILEYADEYKVLPTTDHIKAETGIDVPTMSDEDVRRHQEWFLDTVENFCRHKAMEMLVHEGPDIISQGKYSELERRAKENMLISLQKDLGTDYFLDPVARLERMRDRTDMTPTGWRDIDKKLYGGVNRGEITVWTGGPGTGKSLFLQNQSLNWLQMGLNVVYITLELSEELVGLRFDAMITGMGTKNIFKNMKDVALKVTMEQKRHKWGKLFIKKFPEAGTTANDIRAYVKELEIQLGIKIDALAVDYLDLMHPNNNKVNPSDLFIKDKYVSEELRALVGELNTLGATASQLNRSSIQEQDFDASHIAGGISKINTADNVLAIYASQVMKERGEYQIQFLKTRSSNGVGQKVWLKFNVESLRIYDMDESEQPQGTVIENITKELSERAKAGQVKKPNPSENQYKPKEITSENVDSAAPPARSSDVSSLISMLKKDRLNKVR